MFAGSDSEKGWLVLEASLRIHRIQEMGLSATSLGEGENGKIGQTWDFSTSWHQNVWRWLGCYSSSLSSLLERVFWNSERRDHRCGGKFVFDNECFAWVLRASVWVWIRLSALVKLSLYDWITFYFRLFHWWTKLLLILTVYYSSLFSPSYEISSQLTHWLAILVPLLRIRPIHRRQSRLILNYL